MSRDASKIYRSRQRGAVFLTGLVWLSVPAATVLPVHACLPEPTTLANNEPTPLPQKLMIVPTDGLPAMFLSTLRARLEAQHQFGVTATVAIPVPDDAPIGDSGQYSAAAIAGAGVNTCRRLADANVYCVVLTSRDINEKDSGLRYFFAQHYDGVSVVSAARMNPRNFGGGTDQLSTPLVFDQIQSRVIKMINKGLGLSYYGYALSSDKASVMYAPIMGLDDLDAAGDWYTGRETRHKNFP